MPHLRLASGDGPSEVFVLREDRVVLGRSHDCDLILPDVLLSRRHAEIVRGPEGWALRDLGSLNGTRLNGAPRGARGAAARPGRDRDVRLGPRLPRRGSALRPRPPRGGGAAARRDRPRHPLRPRGGRSRPPEPHPRRPHPRGGRGGGDAHRGGPARRAPRAPPRRRPRAAGGGGALRGRPARRGARRGPRARGAAARGRGSRRSPSALLRSQGAFLAPRVAAEDGSVRSVLCAPLWFSGAPPASERIAGCVALEGPAGPSPFQEEHLQLVTAVANLAASRLETLQLREETVDKRRLEEDLRGAARIQASLLPEETPALPGWELAGSTRLCSEVGADYYDFSPGRRRAPPRARRRGREGPRRGAADGLPARRGAGSLARGRSAAPRGGRGERQPAADGTPEPLRHPLPRPPRDRHRRAALGQRRPRGPLVARADGGHEVLEGTGTILGCFPDARWDEGRTTLGPGRRARPAVGRRPRGRPRGRERPRRPSDSPPWSAPTAAPPRRLSSAPCRRPSRRASGGERRADDHTFVVVRRQTPQ